MIKIILQHSIHYIWFDGVERPLDECDIEHIHDGITNGYNRGELCQTTDVETGDEVGGWWRIEK